MKKRWKKGWLCRDKLKHDSDYMAVFWQRPRGMNVSGYWASTVDSVSADIVWTPREFSRKYKLNFPFPKKGSIHRVEMEF